MLPKFPHNSAHMSNLIKYLGYVVKKPLLEFGNYVTK